MNGVMDCVNFRGCVFIGCYEHGLVVNDIVAFFIMDNPLDDYRANEQQY